MPPVIFCNSGCFLISLGGTHCLGPEKERFAAQTRRSRFDLSIIRDQCGEVISTIKESLRQPLPLWDAGDSSVLNKSLSKLPKVWSPRTPSVNDHIWDRR